MKKSVKIILLIIALSIVAIIAFNVSNIKSAIRVLRMDNSTAVTVEAVHEYLKWQIGASSEIYDDNNIAIHKWKGCNIRMQIVAPDKIYMIAAASYEFKSPEEGVIECPFQQVVDNALEKYGEKGVDIWIPEGESNIIELAMKCKFRGMGDFKSKFNAYGERMSNAANYVRDEAMRLARKNLKDENDELMMLQLLFWGRNS